MTISYLLTCFTSWDLAPIERRLSPGRMRGDNPFAGNDLPSCFSGDYEWRQVYSTEMDRSGPFVFFCFQTSFVTFKVAVNIPLNGTASARIESSLSEGTTQGVRVQMWHTVDTNIMVPGTSQVSGPLHTSLLLPEVP